MDGDPDHPSNKQNMPITAASYLMQISTNEVYIRKFDLMDIRPFHDFTRPILPTWENDDGEQHGELFGQQTFTLVCLSTKNRAEVLKGMVSLIQLVEYRRISVHSSHLHL